VTGPGGGLRRFVPGGQPPGPPRDPAAPAGAPAPGLADAPAAVLERIRAARDAGARPEEACEMCAAAIPPGHGHVADLEQSSLLCTCRACYLLFEHSQAGGGRYRAIPDRYLCDPAHPMTEADLDGLEIPVGLAFFLRSSRASQVPGF